MIENLIWLALGLLVIASIIPRKYELKLTVAGFGVFCVFIGYILIRKHKSIYGNINLIRSFKYAG